MKTNHFCFFQASIYRGCQILIATPQYLARFLNENKNLLSFDRLSYLVLDNIDVILDKYYKSVRKRERKLHYISITYLKKLIRHFNR